MLVGLVAIFPSDLVIHCGMARGEGMCAHVGLFFRSLPALESVSHETFLAALSRVAVDVEECAAMRHWYSALLREIAALVAGACHEKHCIDDPRRDSFSADGGGARPKRMRIDEDLKKLVASSNAGGGGANMLRSIGSLSASLAAKWSTIECSHYISASWMTFNSARIIGVAPDGSRLGNPSEETIVYTMFSPDKGMSCWLPPQASL